MTGTGERIGDCSGGIEQAPRVRQFALPGGVAEHRVAPETPVGLVAAREGEDDRQRDLAVAEIVAGILAHRRGVTDIVDRIVDQLERDAEVAAVRLKARLDRRGPFGDDGGDLARGGEQHGGLGGDNLEIAVFGRVDVALCGQLRHLALGDHRRRARQDAEDTRATRPRPSARTRG